MLGRRAIIAQPNMVDARSQRVPSRRVEQKAKPGCRPPNEAAPPSVPDAEISAEDYVGSQERSTLQ
jgi:hypothetical protein